LKWDRTTLVLVEAAVAGKKGIGFSYADSAVAHLIQYKLAELVRGQEIMDISRLWLSMVQPAISGERELLRWRFLQ
jgi:hypothetical protein